MAPKSDPRKIFRCSCLFCGEMFQGFSYLSIHMRKHTEERPYSCNTCSKDFKSGKCVKKHKRSVHLDVRNFKCDKCGKCFKQKQHLLGHQLSHSKHKSFKCDECGKLYNLKSNLLRHKKGHNKEEPYACNLCEKRYTDGSNLRRHEKSAHSGRTQFKTSTPRKPHIKTPNLMTDRPKPLSNPTPDRESFKEVSETVLHSTEAHNVWKNENQRGGSLQRLQNLQDDEQREQQPTQLLQNLQNGEHGLDESSQSIPCSSSESSLTSSDPQDPLISPNAAYNFSRPSAVGGVNIGEIFGLSPCTSETVLRQNPSESKITNVFLLTPSLTPNWSNEQERVDVEVEDPITAVVIEH